MAFFELFVAYCGIYVTISVILLFICTSFYLQKKDQYNLPPGPVKLPVIGTVYYNILRLDRASEVRQRYGEVSTHYLGKRRVIILSSYNVLKQVSDLNVFMDRTAPGNSFTLDLINPHQKGFLQCNYSQEIRNTRTATVSILRHLGIGQTIMEEKLLTECEYLLSSVREHNGSEFDPADLFTCIVTNVIVSILLNKRHHHDDEEFQKVRKSIDDTMDALFYTTTIDTFTFLRFFPLFKAKFKDFLEGNNVMLDYMWTRAKQRIAEFEQEPVTDFIQGWLDKNYDNTKKNLDIDVEQFRYVLRDMLLAGVETTSTSLKWSVIYLVNRPEIQAKLHAEIENMIGREKTIRLSDREHLPYLEAFILEIQRFCSVVPYGVTHVTQEATKIGPYDIPARTDILFNIHGVHMNEATFGDPHVFRPERFIDANGRFVKHPHVIPFGIGKRLCIGKLLAQQELFIFTGALLQKFELLPPKGLTKINDKGTLSFTHIPNRFKVRAIPRI